MITLEIRSEVFSFERATACLLPVQWESDLLDRDEAPSNVCLRNNRVEKVPIARAGDFLLMMADLSVARRSDGRLFTVPAFVAPEPIHLGEDDLVRGGDQRIGGARWLVSDHGLRPSGTPAIGQPPPVVLCRRYHHYRVHGSLGDSHVSGFADSLPHRYRR